MFKAETKALVKSLGSKELIPNKDLNQDLDLLTLVRIKQGMFWGTPRIKVLKCTLAQLIGEEFSPDVTETDLVKDFKKSMKTAGNCELDGGLKGAAEAKLSAKMDVTDGMVQPVTIRKKTVDLDAVRKKVDEGGINKDKLKRLKQEKKNKLAFVCEVAYNTEPVTMTRKGNLQGCVSGSYQSMLKMCVSANRGEETEFTVKKHSTIAYSLVEIKLEDGSMEIPYEAWIPKGGLFTDALGSDVMEQVQDEIKMKENLLKPIEGLKESTRAGLLKRLREVLEEDGLSELEDTLDQSNQGLYEPPESKAVSSFMSLLDESKVSTKEKDALHVLIMAMDVLPVEALQVLVSGSHETLAVLCQLVESLRDDGEACLPASPPVPLQQDGELRWAADLLCSSGETLTELSESWGRPPEVLLEVLALTVLGVQKLQPRD